jgi:hypothetical protein
MTHAKTITLFEEGRYGPDNSPPEQVTEFIAWLEALLAQVPPEYRSNTMITVKSDGDYDDPLRLLSVWYNRPETEDEARAAGRDMASDYLPHTKQTGWR